MSDHYETSENKELLKSVKQWTIKQFRENAKDIMDFVITPRRESIGEHYYNMTKAFIFGSMRRLEGQKDQLTARLNKMNKAKDRLYDRTQKDHDANEALEEIKEMITNFCEHAIKEPEVGKKSEHRLVSRSYAQRVLKDLEFLRKEQS